MTELGTSKQGLGKNKAKARLLKYGENRLPEAKVDNLAIIFLRQFQSPLIFILLIVTVVVFSMGKKIDGLVILFVIFFNSIVGTIQEGKAQNVFLALKKFVKTKASVIREKEEISISGEEVTVGDILVLREGEKIPTDARLIQADSFQVDESALTGESNPKFKTAASLREKNVALCDRSNMIFKGTNVVSGYGRAVVTAVGRDTVIGGISEKMVRIMEDLPLKDSFRRFSNFIVFAVIGISLGILGIGMLYGHTFQNIFLVIIAMIVSIIPEGLPIVVTLVLATGMWRMGKFNVLVKKLQAVEALGQISVIAVDKTGTVTKNELEVKEVYAGGNLFSIGGVGYEPKGKIKLKNEIIESLNHPELLLVGKISALCSNANLSFLRNLGKWKISGDPTEAASLVLAEKIGFHRNDLEKELPKIDEKPFNHDLKYHATLHDTGNGRLLSVSGAPEKILEISQKFWSQGIAAELSEEKKKELEKVFLKMSERGFRVIALGMKEIQNRENIQKKITALTFVGFLGIEDVPRTEVKAAISRVKSAGIRLVMITGDHEVTAKSIAEEIGIFKTGDRILNGAEIEKMSEEELADNLKKTSVFARVSPIHKLKIIKAYKSRGEIIAMTGDGINDALSLTSADVGVAMGKIGTEVAKEASDIILLDDNFGSIVTGMEEGRNIYKTIKKVILYLFSTSLGEVLAITGAIFLGFPIPILAAQILWLNLVTDGFLDMALAMEPKEPGLLGKKIQKRERNLVDKLMVRRMLIMAVPMAVGTLFLFSRYYQHDLTKAWTISLTTLAVFQWFNAWNCRSEEKSIFSLNFFSNKFLLGATGIVIILQFLALYNPFFQAVLRTVPLGPKEWLIIIAASFSIIIFEETRKLIYRWRKSLIWKQPTNN